MDIGTDKPSLEERSRIPHHLVGIRYPDERWSVEEFQREASKAIEGIWARNSIPCVTGGTGFYIRALLRNYPLENAPPNLDLRNRLRKMAEEKGNQAVHALLKDTDPESWKSLHPNDLKRVIRAIEYYDATGKPISERKRIQTRSPYDYLMIGIRWPRQELYRRIDNRVDDQFRRGFVEETERLLDMGYSEDLPSLQGLGYKEICYYLRGLLTLEETKNLIKRNTRQFAKRQFTWFAREIGIIWVTMDQDTTWQAGIDRVETLVDQWYRKAGENWRD